MPSLVLTSLVWAVSFGLIKHYLGRVEPSFVAFSRLALACLLFLPWLRLRGVRTRGAFRLGLLGAIQFGLMYSLYLLAFRRLQAYQVAMLTIMTPIWVCLIEDVMRRRFSFGPVLAALLATVGAAVVLSGGRFGRPSWEGIALVQASNACFALGQVAYRRIRPSFPGVPERSLMAWLYLGAVAVTLPLASVDFATSVGQLTLREAAVLSYLGFVASGLGFFLWNHGALQVKTATLAVMNDVKTPLGVAVSLLVFGESVRMDRLLIGGVIVVGAVLVARQRAAGD